MAGFTVDKKDTKRAYGQGALQGGLSGAATGASIGSAAGPYGAVVGGIVGAVAGAVGGGEIAKGQEVKAQKDAYTAEQAALAAKQSAQIDTSAAVREQASTPPASSAYMGAPYAGIGMTGYDRWKTGG